jgi:hypothetical protein
MQNVVQSESRNRPDVFIDHADFLQDQEEGKLDFEVFMNGQSKRLQVLTVGVGRLISDMKLIETILLILANPYFKQLQISHFLFIYGIEIINQLYRDYFTLF